MQFPVTAIIKSANFSGIIFLCVLFKSFIKKWKKVLRHSVWRGTVQGARKCIPAGFLRFFGNLKWSVTEKFLLIFYRKIYYRIPNLCKWPEMGLLNIPLKTASFQRLYFTFNFKIRNVTYMIHFYFLLLQQKNRSLRLATVIVLFDCVLTLVVNNGC